MKWIILLLGISSNATASVLIKFATLPPHKMFSLSDPLAVLNNLPFWGGLAFYGIAFGLYTLALSLFPLNVAYPILTSGAISVVVILSAVIFHESLSWTMGAGVVFVMLGVILLTA